MPPPRRRAWTAGCAALLAVAAPATASARLSIVYDAREPARALLAPGPDGTPAGPAAGWLQQAPGAEDVLPADRRAGKVTSGAGGPATPGIGGRGAADLAALLQGQITSAGAHLVFVDELTAAQRGEGGRALADALALLDRPSPWGGTWARRVHVYVPTLPDLLAAPERWPFAWQALARAGGVWFQTYRGNLRPWTAEEWATWTPAWRRRISEAGGDPARLHPVISRGDRRRCGTGRAPRARRAS